MVEQGIARAAVQPKQVARGVKDTEVGHAPDVEDGHRLRWVGKQALVEQRHQGGALSAGSDIAARLTALRARIELDYLKQDIPMLMGESKEGLSRVRKIVQDLKDFSHVDESGWQDADLNAGNSAFRQSRKMPSVHGKS